MNTDTNSAFSSPDTHTYDLGQHILETSSQGVELSNQSVSVQLDTNEAYRLLLALQLLFAPSIPHL